jgi:hypothetical protein
MSKGDVYYAEWALGDDLYYGLMWIGDNDAFGRYVWQLDWFDIDDDSWQYTVLDAAKKLETALAGEYYYSYNMIKDPNAKDDDANARPDRDDGDFGDKAGICFDFAMNFSHRWNALTDNGGPLDNSVCLIMLVSSDPTDKGYGNLVYWDRDDEWKDESTPLWVYIGDIDNAGERYHDLYYYAMNGDGDKITAALEADPDDGKDPKTQEDVAKFRDSVYIEINGYHFNQYIGNLGMDHAWNLIMLDTDGDSEYDSYVTVDPTWYNGDNAECPLFANYYIAESNIIYGASEKWIYEESESFVIPTKDGSYSSLILVE